MALREFPHLLLREQSNRVELVATTVNGGRSLSGVQPVIAAGGGGLWRIDYGSVSLRTKQQVQCWRAVKIGLDGGATAMIVPMCDKRHQPFPGSPPTYSLESVTWSDGAFFSDGSGWDHSIIAAELSTAAALRATTIAIEAINMAALIGGEFFSIAHATMGHRLYQVRGVESVVGAVTTVTIRPPLREATVAGTPLEFDTPRCTMRLAVPDSGALELDLRRFGAPSIAFIEALAPLGM